MRLIIRTGDSSVSILDLEKATQIKVAKRYLRVNYGEDYVVYEFKKEFKDIDMVASYIAAMKGDNLYIDVEQLLEMESPNKDEVQVQAITQ